jgi:zinc/manganese transport system permease protein
VATWLGVLLAYDSYYWFPSRNGWPVSFFVVTLIFLLYLLSQIRFGRRSILRRAGVATQAG